MTLGLSGVDVRPPPVCHSGLPALGTGVELQGPLKLLGLEHSVFYLQIQN